MHDPLLASDAMAKLQPPAAASQPLAASLCENASLLREYSTHAFFRSDRDETPVDAQMFKGCLEHYGRITLNDARRSGPMLRPHTFMGQIQRLTQDHRRSRQPKDSESFRGGWSGTQREPLPASVCRATCRRTCGGAQHICMRIWAALLVLVPVLLDRGFEESMPLWFVFLVWVPSVGVAAWCWCIRTRDNAFRQEDTRLAAIVFMANCSTSSNRLFMLRRHAAQIARCSLGMEDTATDEEDSDSQMDPDDTSIGPWPAFLGINRLWNEEVMAWAKAGKEVTVNPNGKSFVGPTFWMYYFGVTMLHCNFYPANVLRSLLKWFSTDKRSALALIYVLLTYVALLFVWYSYGLWQVPSYLMLLSPALAGVVLSPMFMEDVIFLNTAEIIAASFLHMLRDNSRYNRDSVTILEGDAKKPLQQITVMEHEQDLFSVDLYHFLTDTVVHQGAGDEGVQVLRAFDFLMMIKFFRMQFCTERIILEAATVCMLFGTVVVGMTSFVLPQTQELGSCIAFAAAGNCYQHKRLADILCANTNRSCGVCPGKVQDCWKTLSIDSFLVFWGMLGLLQGTLLNVSSALEFNKLFITDLTNVLDAWAEKIRWLLWSRQSEQAQTISPRAPLATSEDATGVLTNRLTQVDWAIGHLSVANSPVTVVGVAVTPQLITRLCSACASVLVVVAPGLLKQVAGLWVKQHSPHEA